MGFLSSLGKIAGIAAAPFTGGTSLALTAAGTALDVGSSLYSASRAGKAASANRSFQENMSNTSYQRATADMRAAGLNPILAYSQGGASTPSGSVADTSSLNQAHGTRAIQNASTLAQTANIQQSTKTSAADAILKLAQARNASANTAATMADLPKKSLHARAYGAANSALDTITHPSKSDRAYKRGLPSYGSFSK